MKVSVGKWYKKIKCPAGHIDTYLYKPPPYLDQEQICRYPDRILMCNVCEDGYEIEVIDEEE
jgi:hypothetical protein